jgi:hypothetical protein
MLWLFWNATSFELIVLFISSLHSDCPSDHFALTIGVELPIHVVHISPTCQEFSRFIDLCEGEGCVPRKTIIDKNQIHTECTVYTI